MLANVTGQNCQWLCTGKEFFAAMLAAIDSAQRAVCLETYIYSAGPLGERFRQALVEARGRGARVRVLVDGLGSYSLPGSFWAPLESSGGEVRRFNPVSLNRLGIRNHRKLLVCDEQVAFIGGFNISQEYDGDGVSSGWCDLGLRLEGPLVSELADSFEVMFARAGFQHKPFLKLRRYGAKKTVAARGEQLLLSGPGRGRSPIKGELLRDLHWARKVQLMVGYFLPPWRLRRQLVNVVRRGGTVQLLLAGKSDVAVSLLAARSLYRRLLRGGIEIYEYRPQVLHAKLYVLDQAVYAGSANLDQRSLNLNYELMVRFDQPQMAQRAREVFARALTQSVRIHLEDWLQSRSFLMRLKQRWAYWLLVRLDPYLAQRQWRRLPD
jgi:cardiolipin synthase A/B